VVTTVVAGATLPAEGDGEAPRIAAVFSGTTTDADYTFLGLQALQSAEKQYGAETTYSESVAVPDAQRVLREYVADGYTVIWTHGSQFYDATVAVAEEAPDVVFIAEQDTQPADVPDNVWVLDRNFHLAFYPLGVLAGRPPRRASRSPTWAGPPCRSPTPRCTPSSRRWRTSAPRRP
jgi:basic membrane protein A